MDLTETIKKLIDGTQDPEVLKNLAEVQRAVEEERLERDKEKKEMTDKYSSLLSDYKKAVMEAPLPPRGTPEEKGEEVKPAPSLSLEEAFLKWKASQNKGDK